MSEKIPTVQMKDGNKIPALGLGTYSLKGDECIRAVRKALDLGYRHIDTAEMYSNEKEIGEGIKEFERNELFITSKVWPTNLHYNEVKSACQKSLEKLKTSYLDLYLIHWPNNSVSIGETLEAMNDLEEEGKIESIGVSNFTIEDLKEAMNAFDAPIAVNQVEFHPWLYQEELLEFCKDNDILLTAYAPLARTKVFRDETIQKLSDKYGKTPAQIVLRWELEKGVATIPKASVETHLKENLQVLDWKLSAEDSEKVDNISKKRRLVNFHYGNF